MVLSEGEENEKSITLNNFAVLAMFIVILKTWASYQVSGLP